MLKFTLRTRNTNAVEMLNLEPVLGCLCHTLRPLKSHLASTAEFHVENKEPKQIDTLFESKNLIY